ILESVNGLKALSVGRVIVVNNRQHLNALGVILQVGVVSNDAVNRTFTALIICEKGNEEVDQKGEDSTALPHLYNTALNDPPGQAISTATQELLRLAEANPGGMATLDPVNDLQLKSVDVVEGSMRLRVLQDSLRDFNCIHSPTFAEQFARIKERMSVQEELDRLLFLVSDQSLTLLPEYHQRIKVLQSLQYIDSSGAVQLKGRVACQISSHELLLTELLFENVLSPLAPEEGAALLSCLVFTQNTQTEPHITGTLKEGIDRVLSVAQRIGQLQRDCGIPQTAEEFVGQFKFGLTEVVYCWARGMVRPATLYPVYT
ncbi:hypothetical protein XENOCAPTIV_006663, partial [Xenoophorus captivus]